MENAMTPSKTTTDGQIDKAVAKYRALLVKHAPHFNAEAVQSVLGQEELAGDMFGLFRTRIEALSKFVTRSASIDRKRSQVEAFKATGRVQYVNEVVTNAMPLCTGDHVEMGFINLGRDVACDKLDVELGKLGFELIVDPQGLAGINEADPAFADKYPNGTQWKDVNGKYCYAVFYRWSDERRVYVDQDDYGWHDNWWFPVRRK